MGGQASAAGSSLYAAMKATLKIESAPMIVQHELTTKCIVLRWTDDLLQLWDWAGVSFSTSLFLREASAVDAYGEG